MQGSGFGRWWPLLGLFLFLPCLLGHFAFGCHHTDPGTTTDPGVTTNPQSSDAALSSIPPSANPPTASLAFLLVPFGGGLVALISRATRNS